MRRGAHNPRPAPETSLTPAAAGAAVDASMGTPVGVCRHGAQRACPCTPHSCPRFPARLVPQAHVCALLTSRTSLAPMRARARARALARRLHARPRATPACVWRCPAPAASCLPATYGAAHALVYTSQLESMARPQPPAFPDAAHPAALLRARRQRMRPPAPRRVSVSALCLILGSNWAWGLLGSWVWRAEGPRQSRDREEPDSGQRAGSDALATAAPTPCYRTPDLGNIILDGVYISKIPSDCTATTFARARAAFFFVHPRRPTTGPGGSRAWKHWSLASLPHSKAACGHRRSTAAVAAKRAHERPATGGAAAFLRAAPQLEPPAAMSGAGPCRAAWSAKVRAARQARRRAPSRAPRRLPSARSGVTQLPCPAPAAGSPRRPPPARAHAAAGGRRADARSGAPWRARLGGGRRDGARTKQQELQRQVRVARVGGAGGT